MQAYPWDLADPRKRPKRLSKKLKVRCNWRRCPPKGNYIPALAVALASISTRMHHETFSYVPTRKGVRRANMFEAIVGLGSSLRFIAKDHVGPVNVTTIFLFVDHAVGMAPRPVLWETMIFHENSVSSCDRETFRDMGFGPEEADYLGQEQWRYTSRKDAVAHHEKLVGMLRSALY